MKTAVRAITEPATEREAPAVIDLPPPRPRGRRRPVVNPRIARIELRTTPARKTAIHTAAEQAGMSITDYLLTNLPGWTETPRLIAIADPKILARMLAELGKWGSNINQLAREMNTTGQGPELAELERIYKALWDIREAVLRALGQ
jgi:Bacterial mobilisation protein (MobC)/Protein of unknown function (DUF1778)